MTSSTNFSGPVKVQGRYVATLSADGSSLVDQAGNQYSLDTTKSFRRVGIDLEQPIGTTEPVSNIGKLAARFGSGMWLTLSGAPTLTQGYTGWDASGNKTGIVSRTGQPDMLKVVPAANTTEQIELKTFPTNMLTPALGGVIGLWVYVENQPGYDTGAGSGTITLSMATSGAYAYTNGVIAAFNANQIREGWNFLQFRMRNPAAYVAGAVAEDHPYGLNSSKNGTGADSDIVNNPITALKIYWDSMSGATLYFDSIWTGFSSVPTLALGCDLGVNFEEIAVPIFQDYGWVGYTAFPFRVWSTGNKQIADLTNPEGTTEDILPRIYSKGWDATNHTANHLANGTLTTAAEIAYELETAKAWQLSIGMPRGSEFYCSPQSSSSRLSEKVIKTLGYKLQRHARKWNTTMTPFGIDNPQHLGGLAWGSNTAFGVTTTTGGVATSATGQQKFSQIKRNIDCLLAYGDSSIVWWHGITTTGDNGLGEDLTGDNLLITASAFRMAMAYIRSLELAGAIVVARGLSGFYYGRY